MKKKRISNIAIVICVLIAVTATIAIDWLYDAFGNLSINEIIFQLKVPMQGTSTQLVEDFLIKCPWKIIVGTVMLSFALILPAKKWGKSTRISLILSIILLVASIIRIIIVTELFKYIGNQLNTSTFIEEEYVNPENVAIEFPEQKRNLIYIFLESMETTYFAKEDGGLSEQDLIPEISRLAKENLNFSNTSKLGGAHSTYATTWTVAAMTAQTAGIPLKIGVDDNAMSEYSVFLEGAYTIGEILEDNGYTNYLLVGSDATFGGRRNLFTQHGNYTIWDYNNAVEEHKIQEKVWWGYSDDNLFKFAKEKITMLAQDGKPFNFTTLTVDTHFQDGYYCEDCPRKWDEKYKNVISCSSQKVGEFVKWIQEQDFYENTTIVIAGDHLTMQTGGFFEIEEGQEYDKKVVHLIINPAEEPENTSREYSTYDMYPTTLRAIGDKIEGNK